MGVKRAAQLNAGLGVATGQTQRESIAACGSHIAGIALQDFPIPLQSLGDSAPDHIDIGQTESRGRPAGCKQ